MVEAVFYIGDPIKALEATGVKREMLPDNGLSFIRRSFDGGWNYFIANRTETNFAGWITLSRIAKSAVALNPQLAHRVSCCLGRTLVQPKSV